MGHVRHGSQLMMCYCQDLPFFEEGHGDPWRGTNIAEIMKLSVHTAIMPHTLNLSVFTKHHFVLTVRPIGLKTYPFMGHHAPPLHHC